MDNPPQNSKTGLLVLTALALAVGVVTGLVCAWFRLALEMAGHWRDSLIQAVGGWGAGGLPAIIAVCAAAGALAAWLVRRFSPFAAGSGIPHVESVIENEMPPVDWRLIPVKFLGGWLAIGAGMALGREGPSVQLGASLASLVAKFTRRNKGDFNALFAAGAGAGLATTFNAPLTGAIFVLEELVRRFEMRITLAALGASAAAIAVAREFIGTAPDFHVAAIPAPGLPVLPAFLLLGVVAGFLGLAYNLAITGTMAGAKRLDWLPVEWRAGLVGAVVGWLAWMNPSWVGGGDLLTQRVLSGAQILGAVPLIFLVRFCLGPVSYAAGTPGGLFAPALVIGAQAGLVFAALGGKIFPALALDPAGFALVGMAAFLAAVVRAPVTGIVLVIELTGVDSQLVPMLAACFTAFLVPTLFGNPPIYDSLKTHPKTV